MFESAVKHSFALSQEELTDLCAVFSEEDGVCLLYSGGSFETAAQSFLCLFPQESVWVEDGTTHHIKAGCDAPGEISRGNPWDCLKDLFPKGNANDSPLPDWVGYFGYEMGSCSDFEKTLPHCKSPIPQAFFYRHAVICSISHASHKMEVSLRSDFKGMLSVRQEGLVEKLRSKDSLKELVKEGRQRKGSRNEDRFIVVKPVEPYASYQKKVAAAREYILDGEIYQVNLSQQILLRGTCEPYGIFAKLAQLNPAPFMGYCKFPSFTIISSSPERFLSKRNGVLETRPIKGTAPRASTPEHDVKNKEGLLASPKERAELLMITDLMRNDLGRVSLTGSVKTDKIWHCEEYANVFHLLSIIRSLAKPQYHPVDIVREAFPGGSITGCPKLRAMEVIHELEGRPRGVYTGSIGYFSANGDFDFNIAIRTLLWKDGLLDIQLGGAVVADSDPRAEYEETLHKGASLFKAIRYRKP